MLISDIGLRDFIKFEEWRTAQAAVGAISIVVPEFRRGSVVSDVDNTVRVCAVVDVSRCHRGRFMTMPEPVAIVGIDELDELLADNCVIAFASDSICIGDSFDGRVYDVFFRGQRGIFGAHPAVSAKGGALVDSSVADEFNGHIAIPIAAGPAFERR